MSRRTPDWSVYHRSCSHAVFSCVLIRVRSRRPDLFESCSPFSRDDGFTPTLVQIGVSIDHASPERIVVCLVNNRHGRIQFSLPFLKSPCPSCLFRTRCQQRSYGLTFRTNKIRSPPVISRDSLCLSTCAPIGRESRNWRTKIHSCKTPDQAIRRSAV